MQLFRCKVFEERVQVLSPSGNRNSSSLRLLDITDLRPVASTNEVLRENNVFRTDVPVHCAPVCAVINISHKGIGFGSSSQSGLNHADITLRSGLIAERTSNCSVVGFVRIANDSVIIVFRSINQRLNLRRIGSRIRKVVPRGCAITKFKFVCVVFKTNFADQQNRIGTRPICSSVVSHLKLGFNCFSCHKRLLHYRLNYYNQIQPKYTKKMFRPKDIMIGRWYQYKSSPFLQLPGSY